MILKLIETKDTPKIGDLIRFPSGRLHIATQDGITNKGYVHGTKAVKPYGISSSEIQSGDYRYSSIQNNVTLTNPVDIETGYYIERSDAYKKVNILPEQFYYQDIVDLGLKDGDEFKAEPLYSLGYPTELSYRITPVYNYEDLTSTEIKPSPVTYTEEEVLNMCGNLSVNINNGAIRSDEDIVEWFNLNKKK